MVKYAVLTNGVVRKGDRMLVIKRSSKEVYHAGKWSIPGGKLEYEEDTFDALEQNVKKEIREETGIEVSNIRHLLNNIFLREDGELKLVVVFLCDYASGEYEPTDETDEAKWITKEEAMNMEFSHENVKNYLIAGFNYEKI
jgi:8-oxo-dGTP pyrophosphatase MutT (NUDIX family)